VVSHLGEILSRARHHLCGSRREAKGRKRSGNNQVLHRSLPCFETRRLSSAYYQNLIFERDALGIIFLEPFFRGFPIGKPPMVTDRRTRKFTGLRDNPALTIHQVA
jgi:hypothetical protein